MTTPLPDNTTMERLRLLRAKAESLLEQDPESPEGLAFQEHYLTLLAKYSLEDAALATGTDTDPVASVRYAYPARTWATKRSQLIHHVCRVFELPHHTIQIQGSDQWEMLICGRPAAIESAIAICQHLLPQLQRFIIALSASSEYQELHGNARSGFASDGIDSWIARITGRLAVLHASAKEDTHTPDPQGNALVLADQYHQAANLLDERVQQLQEAVGLTQKSQPPSLRYRSDTAHHMGTAAADRADLGQTRVDPTAPHRPALGQ